MKKTGVFQFVAGVLVGAVMFGGSAAFAAAGIPAQPKTAEVVIDGQAADLEGYVIEGNHYFRLRDLASALMPGGKGFSVVWDEPGNRVIIDTSRGYDANERYVPISAPPTATAGPEMTIDEMKAEIIRLTNIERVKAGVPELKPLPELMESAQAKADDMRDNAYFAHISPIYGTPGEMIRSFVPNTNGSGENIKALYSRTGTVREAFDGWASSPEHSENMLSPEYTHTGIGIVIYENGGQKWVQQFAVL